MFGRWFMVFNATFNNISVIIVAGCSVELSTQYICFTSGFNPGLSEIVYPIWDATFLWLGVLFMYWMNLKYHSFYNDMKLYYSTPRWMSSYLYVWQLVVSADKAPNKILFLCKSHHTDCLIKELCIDNSLVNPTEPGVVKLTSLLLTFYGRHLDLVNDYGISVSQMTMDMFHLS